jgi:hypothetical protein|tara:strand:- start:245 stop:391 length:147 start_codon:yes stop_codon:yes gene_type:complete
MSDNKKQYPCFKFWENNYNPITMWRRDDVLDKSSQHIRTKYLDKGKEL